MAQSNSRYFNNKNKEPDQPVINSILSTSHSADSNRWAEQPNPQRHQVLLGVLESPKHSQNGGSYKNDSKSEAQNEQKLKIKLKFQENSYQLLGEKRNSIESERNAEKLEESIVMPCAKGVMKKQPSEKGRQVLGRTNKGAIGQGEPVRNGVPSEMEAGSGAGAIRKMFRSRGIGNKSVLFDFTESQSQLTMEEEIETSLRSASRFNERLIYMRRSMGTQKKDKGEESGGDGQAKDETNGVFLSAFLPVLVQDGFQRVHYNANGSLNEKSASVRKFIKLNIDNEFNKVSGDFKTQGNPSRFVSRTNSLYSTAHSSAPYRNSDWNPLSKTFARRPAPTESWYQRNKAKNLEKFKQS